MDDAAKEFIFSMNDKDARLSTFKNWPFKSKCRCVPEKMAEAGFFHCPTNTDPDLVQCYMCLKELDGWEPNDDPWKEHESHSKDCPHLHLNDQKEMTIVEFVKAEMQRQIWTVKRSHEKQEREFDTYTQEARQAMEMLGDD